MWRCAVLMSVCCVGLAVARGLLDDVHPDSDQNMNCGTNEYFERCFNNCAPEQTCDTRKVEQLCPAVVRPCVSKCICKEGYYRKSGGGECIPEEECGPACREGEVYSKCSDPCINDSCEAMGSLIPNCTSPEPCEPGCVCAEGSYRLYEYLPCVPKCYCHNFKHLSECKN